MVTDKCHGTHILMGTAFIENHGLTTLENLDASLQVLFHERNPTDMRLCKVLKRYTKQDVFDVKTFFHFS